MCLPRPSEFYSRIPFYALLITAISSVPYFPHHFYPGLAPALYTYLECQRGIICRLSDWRNRRRHGQIRRAGSGEV